MTDKNYREQKKREKTNLAIKSLLTRFNLNGEVEMVALQIHETLFEKFKWRKVTDIARACVLASCRMNESPMNLSCLVDGLQERKSLQGCLKLILKDFKVYQGNRDYPSIFKYRARKHGFPGDVNEHATSILKVFLRIDNHKDPNGYMAASLYLAGKHLGEKHTQEEISEVFKVNTTTLRRRMREMKL